MTYLLWNGSIAYYKHDVLVPTHLEVILGVVQERRLAEELCVRMTYFFQPIGTDEAKGLHGVSV